MDTYEWETDDEDESSSDDDFEKSKDMKILQTHIQEEKSMSDNKQTEDLRDLNGPLLKLKQNPLRYIGLN